MYDFGITLKNLRKKNKMTQLQLAKRLNVSESLISRYESNEVQPSLDTLRTLAAVLNVSVDELCGTEPRETVSLYGLSKQQTQLVKTLIENFRYSNTAQGAASDDFSSLGFIVAGIVEGLNKSV